MIINGNILAEKILDKLKDKKTSKEFVAILVGDDPASLSFLKQKEKVAESLGVIFRLEILSEELSQAELESRVRSISQEEKTGALIVQLPLPKKYNKVPVLNAIGIRKDVDVLNGETTSILPPSVGALEEILQSINFNTEGKTAVVIGPGMLIGEPVAKYLMKCTKKLLILNKGAVDKESVQEGDLVVVSAGVPRLVTSEHIKEGAVVIDYGYKRENGKLTGDVDFEEVKEIGSFITPTPGGTGPLVVAKLFENFFKLVD